MIGKIKQLFQLFSAALICCWLHQLMIHAGGVSFLRDSDYILACFPNRRRAKRLQSTWSNVFLNGTGAAGQRRFSQRSQDINSKAQRSGTNHTRLESGRSSAMFQVSTYAISHEQECAHTEHSAPLIAAVLISRLTIAIRRLYLQRKYCQLSDILDTICSASRSREKTLLQLYYSLRK